MGLDKFRFKFPQQAEPPTATGRSSLAIEQLPPPSPHGSSFHTEQTRRPKYEFKSYRLKGDYVQPWADDKRMKRTKYNNYIIYGFVVLGIAISGYLAYDGVKAAKTGDWCIVMDDNFDKGGIDDSHWTHEVQSSGFGTGSFDWTTTDAKNSFTDAQGLHIVPTVTTESTDITEAQLYNGYTLNLTKSGGDGSCTSDDYTSCSVRSNETTGVVLPPVRSARLSTKGKKFIKYGKVEVTAKMPAGDWLWPAIWMMPEESKYGPWPASGEIDIAELRGNAPSYPLGRDGMTSTLHWGPNSKMDGYWRTFGTHFARRTDLSKGFHTYGLMWTKNYIFTYIDSTLKQVYYMRFDQGKTLWEAGQFDGATVNNSVVENPWKSTGNTNTPFDESFYLILNVAVGANNGWFYDGKGNKPWVDNSPTAARDFIKAKDQWLPTWGEGPDRGMTVKSAKMWSEGKCGAAPA